MDYDLCILVRRLSQDRQFEQERFATLRSEPPGRKRCINGEPDSPNNFIIWRAHGPRPELILGLEGLSRGYGVWNAGIVKDRCQVHHSRCQSMFI